MDNSATRGKWSDAIRAKGLLKMVAVSNICAGRAKVLSNARMGRPLGSRVAVILGSVI